MAAYAHRSQNIDIETNAFEIYLPRNDLKYLQYDDIKPLQAPASGRDQQMPRAKKIKLFHHLQNVVAATVFSSRMVYDGQSIAFSPQRIDFPGGQGTGGSFIIHLNQKSTVPHGTRGAYEIRLSPTIREVISLRDVEELIRDRNSSAKTLVATNLMQLVMRQGPNMKHQTNNGRAYYSGARGSTKPTARGVELWQGIFISVRPTIGKMILTMDTTVAAVFKSGHLITLCMEYLKLNNVGQLILTPNNPLFKRLEKFLLNLRIVVQTGGTRSRPKTIRSLVHNAGEFTFLKGDEEISVAYHFYQAHNIRIQNPKIVGVCLTGKKSERKEVVPLELCTVEPGQLCKRIPDDVRTDMVKFSTMRPGDRRKKITDEINSYVTSEYLIESGLGVEKRPISIRGKILESPGIVFHQNEVLRPQDGKWNVLRKRLHNASELTSWGVVNFISNSLDMNICGNMMRDLATCCKALGMEIAKPVDIESGHPSDPIRALNSLVEKAQRAGVDGNKFIIIVILPQDAGLLRTQVKHWGDIIAGIPTQCLREGKIWKPNDQRFRGPDNQYWNNIALKLNARLGGRNSHASSAQIMRLLQSEPFIIMGADVGHPSPGVQKPSVSSLVYSYDEHATHYAALTGIQHPRVEMIQDLARFVKTALENFVAKNGIPPRKLIFFRDGVSEGEYQQVASQELEAIRAGMVALWREKGVVGKIPYPLITFVVVTKRHHAVFFPTSQQTADRTGNLHPGCVVDNTITSPDRAIQDFYLQSHAAIQGTCRSSHYVVIHDEIFKDLNRIQDLAYTLCHVYAKATRIVSIPAPVYYADLVCQRSAFHMDPKGPLNMDDDTASTLHSGPAPFDLSMWQQAFMLTNSRMDKKMYFL